MLVVVLTFYVFFFNVPTVCWASAGEGGLPTVTVDLADHSMDLGNLVGEIAEQTGYTILIPKEWCSLPVRGRYVDVQVESFFRRVVRGESIAVSVDEKKKVVLVRSYRSRTGSGAGYVVAGGKKNTGSDGTIGVVEQGLNDFQLAQIGELERLKSDPDAVDPELGIRQGDLWAIQERQLQDLARESDDPDVVDPELGVRQGALWAIQERQLQDLARESDDPDVVDPELGVRQGDLWAIQKRQIQDLARGDGGH